MDNHSRRAMMSGLGFGVVGVLAACSQSDDAAISRTALARTPVDVKAFGAKGDGSTDDTKAIRNAFDYAIANSTAKTAVLLFPPGRYVDSGNHRIADGSRVAIVGFGAGVSVILRTGTVAEPWWSFESPYSSMSGLTLNGARAETTATGVSIDCSYASVENVHFEQFKGISLEIGHRKTAIGHVLHNLQFRSSGINHIRVSGDHSSTDGRWSNIEAGVSGSTGIFIGSGAQNIVNLHVWGAGTSSSVDNSGIVISSSDNSLGSGWQSEKNLGSGLRIAGSNNLIVGGRSWGNVGYALQAEGGYGNIISANSFRDNSIGRDADRSVVVCALDCEHSVFANNVVSQTTVPLRPAAYDKRPVYPYRGRERRAVASRPLIAGAGDLVRMPLQNINAGVFGIISRDGAPR